MAELNVNKSTIQDLFKDMKGKFIIPNYQRPYAWEAEDQCQTLWDDIIEFYDSLDGSDKDKMSDTKEYFLGSMVVVSKKDNNIDDYEIVDGQQRLTSLLLLLRAIFTELASSKDNKIVENLKNKLSSCIWFVDEYTNEPEMSRSRLETFIATDKHKEELKIILKTGKAIDNSKSKYSLNYVYFQNLIKIFIADRPTDWDTIILVIINKIIVFPIKCENIDLALKIFLTINNRGLALSNADLFKSALIDKLKGDKDKVDKLIKMWKELLLEEEASGNFSLDKLFRHYYFITRHRMGHYGNEIKLSDVYLDKNKPYAKDIFNDPIDVMNRLQNLSDFWSNIEKRHNYNGSDFPKKSFKYLDCLSQMPSDRWQEIVSIYFSNYKDLKGDFVDFTKSLFSYVSLKYLFNPSAKGFFNPLYADNNNCIANIVARGELNNSTFKDIITKDSTLFNREKIYNKIKEISENHKSKAFKPLLYIYCYLNQTNGLIPNDSEVEHIFPKKWQEKYYDDFFKGVDNRDYLIECFGNKVLLEKRLNIQASNGYWDKKLDTYQKSSIAEVKENLGKYKDWTAKDIMVRNEKILNELTNWYSETLGIVNK